MATTSIPANCQAVTNALIKESGRLGPELFRRGARQRPIIELQMSTRGAWKNGMGSTISNVTFERSFPTSVTDGRTAVNPSDGDSVNACLPPVTSVSFGQTTRSFQPVHEAFQTEYFCIRDIMMDWQFDKQLGAITDTLGQITTWQWARYFTKDYMTLAGHNIVFSQDGVFDQAGGYDTSHSPTARMEMGLLEDIYSQLYREGGDLPLGTNMDTEAPVFAAIVSKETYDTIMRDNPTLRNSIEFAWMGARDESPVLPSGMPRKRRTFGGFVFFIDPYPRRFILSGGVYVEQPVWVSIATTKGNRQELNNAWLNAPYEETIIWHKSNYRDLAVNTVTNPAPGWKFDPQNYMGDFVPRNILEKTCNPRGDQIFFDAVFSSAQEPLNPKVGYTILHNRCGYRLEKNSCYES